MINLKEKKTETKRIEISKIFGFSSIEIKNNNYLIRKKLYIIYNRFIYKCKSKRKKYNVDESFFNSNRINERLIALISNSVYPGAEDILKFYNLKKKNTIKEKATDILLFYHLMA